MDILRNMFSPQKQPEAPELPQRASPLVEGHPNRVQKPRQRNKASSRRGASRAPRLPARVLGSPELGEERGDSGPSKVSRRYSEFPRPAARLTELSSDDEHNQTITEGIAIDPRDDDDDDGSPIGFASQPAHLQSLVISQTASTQEEIITSTDPEEMHDALDQSDQSAEEEVEELIEEEEEESIVIGLVDPAQDGQAEDLSDNELDVASKVDVKIKSIELEAKDGASATSSAITPALSSESVSDAPVSEAAGTAEPEEEAKEEPEDEGDVTMTAAEGQFSFTEILEHRWVGDEMELKVGWYRDSPTWEPESILHADAPDALFSYWRSQGGRPSNPRDPDIFDIFAIRDHSRDKKRLLVEWTGYEPKEHNSWVARSVVEDTAPEVVAEYWSTIGQTPAAPSSKAKTSKASAPKTKASTKATKAAKPPAKRGEKASTAKAPSTRAPSTRAPSSRASTAKSATAKGPASKVTKRKAPARRNK